MKIQELKIKNQTLMLLVGNIGLGKSSMAKDLVDSGFVVVSYDALASTLVSGKTKLLQGAKFRSLCHKLYDGAIHDALSSGLSVVADNLNTTRSSRKVICSMCREFGVRALAVDFGPGTEEGLDRRSAANDDFNYQGFDFMYQDIKGKYQKPELAEGFELIINNRGDSNG